MSVIDEGLAQSVKTRLVQHAHAVEVDPNLVLIRFATERFLYRLARSTYAERFVLKGALLLLVWLGKAIRPTRDADLLGLGNFGTDELKKVFSEICVVEVEPDGLRFDSSSIDVHAIRPDDAYGGQRVTLLGYLGRARLKIQVDVGLGDAVTPSPEWLQYPVLLDQPAPWLLAYRPETAIAEKLHAMVVLGSRNSRLRDFFDIRALAAKRAFDQAPLTSAVHATFQRRGTPIPESAPLALTESFAIADDKQVQWRAFVRKSGLSGMPLDFEVIVADVARFLVPVLETMQRMDGPPRRWPPGGPWKPV